MTRASLEVGSRQFVRMVERAEKLIDAGACEAAVAKLLNAAVTGGSVASALAEEDDAESKIEGIYDTLDGVTRKLRAKCICKR